MEYEYWKCNRCGRCCTHQKKHMDLFEEDLKLFPSKSYTKQMGYGKKKSEIKTIAWRLIPRRCPLYDESIGCTIYENRPLVCRRFPYTYHGIDDSCANVPPTGTFVKVTAEDLKVVEVFDKYSESVYSKAVEEMGGVLNFWVYKNFKWRPFDPVKHAMKNRNRM